MRRLLSMFVRDFLHVERPFDAVVPRFVGSDLPLEQLAQRAVGPDRDVRCERGALRWREDAIVVPLQFVDAEHPAGLGSLEGELEIAPFDGRTELGFEATYRASGHRRDRELRRTTELAVRSFLEAVGRALED